MSRRQQQKSETAQRIYSAALGLFMQQGFVATTVEQITRAAGVAKGTFFTHFASKEALLDHIGQLQMERISAAIAADPAFDRRAAHERLHLLVTVMAQGLAAQPIEMRALTFEILARRSLLDIDPQNITALDRLFTQIVAAGQARGEIRADVPAARLATVARGAYFLSVFEWLRDPALDLVALARQYLTVALDGLATGRSP